MKVNLSALTHGISEADILHAAAHPVFLSEPDDDMPAKQFASASTRTDASSNWPF